VAKNISVFLFKDTVDLFFIGMQQPIHERHVSFTYDSERPYGGPDGKASTEVINAIELRRYWFKRYHVTRRIQRMNKRLKTELGKPVAESYSRRWILTSFVQHSLTSSKEDIETEIRMDKNFTG